MTAMPQARTLSEPLLQTISELAGLSGDKAASVLPNISRGVEALSQLFIRGGPGSTDSYLDEDGLRRAYLTYYLPVNLAKVQALLEEMPATTFATADRRGTFRILDLGSGPGTTALAALDWVSRHPTLQSAEVEVVSLDRSERAIAEGRRLWEAYARKIPPTRARLMTVRGDLEGGGFDTISKTLGQSDLQGYFDLIVMGNCLNELFRAAGDPIRKRADLIRAAAPLLAPTGTVMIIEPALRDTSRNLHLVRNDLLGQAEPPLGVYSPCLHDRPCPALVKDTDWCHEERPWNPPAFIQAIDQEVRFIKDALKFSYLLLRKDRERIAPDVPEIFRVVSELRVMKGEKRAWLCNQTGRPEVGRLDRLQSPSNAAVDDWHRGAIVRIDQIVRTHKDGREATVGRIPAEATVELIRPI